VLSSGEEPPSSSSEDEDSPKRRRKKSHKFRGRPHTKFDELVAAAAAAAASKPMEVVAVAEGRNFGGVSGENFPANNNRLNVSPLLINHQRVAGLPTTAMNADSGAALAGNIFDFAEKTTAEPGEEAWEGDGCRASALQQKKRGRPLGSKNRSRQPRRPLPNHRTVPDGKLSAKVPPPGDLTREVYGKRSPVFTATGPPTKAADNKGVLSSRPIVGAPSEKDSMRQQQHASSLSFTLAKLGPKMNDLARPPHRRAAAGVTTTSRRLSESSDDDSSVVLSSGESSPRRRDSSSPMPRHENQLSREEGGRQLTPEDEEITALDCEEVELVEEEVRGTFENNLTKSGT
jgi:hypothetical protein